MRHTTAATLLRTAWHLYGCKQYTQLARCLAVSRQQRGASSAHVNKSVLLNTTRTSQTLSLQLAHVQRATVWNASRPGLATSCHAFEGTVLPLSERAADATALLDVLLDWYQHAIAKTQEVGSQYADTDGGPSAEDLLVELNWLLDDAVAAIQKPGTKNWQPATWRQLQPGGLHHKPLLKPSGSDWTVALKADIAALMQLWNKRIQHRVPLQYLNNCCHWREFILAVGPGVLIPRPETELLIDFAQQAIHQNSRLREGPWLDLGTGSGAIAIGLATILPAPTQVYAVDKSQEASAWAQLNLQRLKLQDRVKVMTGSWYSPVQHMQGQFAGIVSNPPYIPSQEMQTLQAEVGEHEPWLALDGGQAEGLHSLQPICLGAACMLQPGGFLALETAGGAQAEQVVTFLKQPHLHFDHVQVRQDLSGVKRFVVAFKRHGVMK